MAGFEGSPPGKRRKLNQGDAPPTTTDAAEPKLVSRSKGLERPISPPFSRRGGSKVPELSALRGLVQPERQDQDEEGGVVEAERESEGSETENERTEQQETGADARTQSTTTQDTQGEVSSGGSTAFLPSPIQLTHIKDLSSAQNVDAVTLNDLLCDPMIKECWNFNYLFDIDFVMKHLDPDVRSLVKVKIIHGFWKKEDERGQNLKHIAERYDNVELINAYIPDPFGTHHSKMLVLLRHDDTAQVVIHTANMIDRDWRNMTQAVWRSPSLPLLAESPTATSWDEKPKQPIGSGERFKTDLLRYLDAYGNRLKGLTTQLIHYDFRSIRAAFIGSAPSRESLIQARPSTQTSWGWPGLREILSSIPVSTQGDTKSPPNIVAQISSIATLGATPAWLTNFQSVLSKQAPSTTSNPPASQGASFFNNRVFTPKTTKPKFNIIFPTPHEIRNSLDGYSSGASIHTKLQSSAQQKQLQYLRPILCHWNHHEALGQLEGIRKAERGPAAPHIKTYIRFSDERQQRIDWAMITSANMSKQAWGEVEGRNREVWIQSWETGVVFWPSLFTDSKEAVEIVPVFGKDMPTEQDLGGMDEQVKKVIGFRMPYDLPLESYTPDEVPWCATMAHQEPDWKGQVWGGY
jgi:tyrosyl-DNA phosphodiesterase-1